MKNRTKEREEKSRDVEGDIREGEREKENTWDKQKQLNNIGAVRKDRRRRDKTRSKERTAIIISFIVSH